MRASPPGRWLTTALFAGAIVFGALAGALFVYRADLPQISSLDQYQPNIITQVFAADGSRIGEFAIERRVVIGFADIPPLLRNAIVAVEDADFWEHLGVNPWRIPAAFIANLRAGRRSQGSSTLTMQLSRLLFLTPEKTYERKLKEAILAFDIEKNFTKEEIFTMYCNQVYFGHGAYGVEAASRLFFSKPAKDLVLGEAATLAAVIQSPARLSPIEHPERATQRRNYVLGRMEAQKYVSPEEAARARQEPLRLRVRRDPPSIAPHFVEEVRKHLEREYGSQRIYQGGLQVHTTLDSRMQEAANRALRDGVRVVDRRSRGFDPTSIRRLAPGEDPETAVLDDWPAGELRKETLVHGVVVESTADRALVRVKELTATIGPRDIAWTGRKDIAAILPRGSVALFEVVSLDRGADHPRLRLALDQEPLVEGAFVALDPRTGAIRALVGGFSFGRSKFDRAVQARRQLGSAFKPVVYAAALERLSLTPATIIDDTPVSYPGSPPETAWRPQNYDLSFEGPITLRRAVEQSRNIPAVRTLEAVGIEPTIEYAHRLGISGDLPRYLPLALGAGEGTLLEITSAFAAFANQGLRMKPTFITKITDRDGNVLEESRSEATDAVRADTAFIVTHLLRGVVQRGTAAAASRLGRPIAGKTGTTDDFTDAWFVGYERSLAAGVWLGYDDKRRFLGRNESGARAALPVWMAFWKEAMKEAPVEEFEPPPNVVLVPVDAEGRRGSPGAPGVVMEAFIEGTEPVTASAPPVVSVPSPVPGAPGLGPSLPALPTLQLPAAPWATPAPREPIRR